jgi:phage terminase Nu1 subunit (DNA packaging protein)
MPKAARGKYDLTACVPWYLKREREAARGAKGLNDLDLARQRKTVAEARLAELERREGRGPGDPDGAPRASGCASASRRSPAP